MIDNALEIALSAARFWRDVGTDLVIGGIAAEVFIEAFLKADSSNFTPPQKHRRERIKKWAMLLAGFVVLTGIGLEWRKSDLSDDIAGQISRTQQSMIIELSARIAPRFIEPSDAKALAEALKPFPSTHVVFWTYPADGEARLLVVQLANMFHAAGWAPARLFTNADPGELRAGVFIATSSLATEQEKILRDALLKSNIGSMEDTPPVPDSAGAALRIWVGVKPIPITPAPDQ